jgi:hypothetical protein
MEELIALEELHLSHNAMILIPEWIENLTQLSVFTINDN